MGIADRFLSSAYWQLGGLQYPDPGDIELDVSSLVMQPISLVSFTQETFKTMSISSNRFSLLLKHEMWSL